MAETTSQARLIYPPAPRQDDTETLHGVPVADPYRWLEDLDAPQTRAWIEAENALTFDFLGKIPAREPIRARLEALWNYERFGVPTKKGGRYFFYAPATACRTRPCSTGSTRSTPSRACCSTRTRCPPTARSR